MYNQIIQQYVIDDNIIIYLSALSSARFMSSMNFGFILFSPRSMRSTTHLPTFSTLMSAAMLYLLIYTTASSDQSTKEGRGRLMYNHACANVQWRPLSTTSEHKFYHEKNFNMAIWHLTATNNLKLCKWWVGLVN